MALDPKVYELIINSYINNFKPSVYLWNGAMIIAVVVAILHIKEKKSSKPSRFLIFITIFLLWFLPIFTERYNYYVYLNAYKDLNEGQYKVSEDFIEDVETVSRYVYIGVNGQWYEVPRYIPGGSRYFNSIVGQRVRITYAANSRIILEMYVYDEETNDFSDITNRELIAEDLEEVK